MPPETARKLDEIYALAKENNRLLHKMRRAAFWSRVWRFLWILVVLGVPVLLYYYFLQPYVGQFFNAYSQIQDGAQKVEGYQLPPEFKQLLERFGIGN